jgi:hypothetical protein
MVRHLLLFFVALGVLFAANQETVQKLFGFFLWYVIFSY